jgi:hypothetical protein
MVRQTVHNNVSLFVNDVFWGSLTAYARDVPISARTMMYQLSESCESHEYDVIRPPRLPMRLPGVVM